MLKIHNVHIKISQMVIDGIALEKNSNWEKHISINYRMNHYIIIILYMKRKVFSFFFKISRLSFYLKFLGREF